MLAFENDYGGARDHQGNDIYAWNTAKAPEPTGALGTIGGSTLVAVDDGDLTFGTDPRGGNIAWVVTDDGAASYYAHLESFIGDARRVKAGEPIGILGRTGNACKQTDGTNCILGQFHLHFGYKPDGKNGNWTNPYTYLKAAEHRRADVYDQGRKPLSRGAVVALTALAAGAVVAGFWAGLKMLNTAHGREARANPIHRPFPEKGTTMFWRKKRLWHRVGPGKETASTIYGVDIELEYTKPKPELKIYEMGRVWHGRVTLIDQRTGAVLRKGYAVQAHNLRGIRDEADTYALGYAIRHLGFDPGPV